MEILGENNPISDFEDIDKGKTAAVVAYLTIIGLIIAFVININKKSTFASYHIKQAIGLTLTGFTLSIIERIVHNGFILGVLSLGLLVLWIMGIVNAITEKQKPVPLLGEKYEEFFKNLNV
ncbi:MAG TPA: hypothetical protein PLJ37_07960 [Chitinophagales bacterium]|nr:hypothetical protein [Chitinophagales bacterium]HMU98389.1 hypothetical protein [Chitinophagales bacterium]HMV02961.1 hypothetical protein [Chitinophagales bacterium]HMY43022.1 hypothetical protein [Chitinophagales bacterium]HMZ94911.1 hypothetical protein [Chitinophagales bacterium]